MGNRGPKAEANAAAGAVAAGRGERRGDAALSPPPPLARNSRGSSRRRVQAARGLATKKVKPNIDWRRIEPSLSDAGHRLRVGIRIGSSNDADAVRLSAAGTDKGKQALLPPGALLALRSFHASSELLLLGSRQPLRQHWVCVGVAKGVGVGALRRHNRRDG